MNKVAGWLFQLTLLSTLGFGAAGAASCPGDIDGDNRVTVDELVQAVNGALTGCPAAVNLAQAYDGDAAGIRNLCADPGDNGSFTFQEATVRVDEQHGSQFSGALTGKDNEGEPVSIHLDGSVDAQGFVNGTVWDDEGEISGSVRGLLAGDGLALTASVFETADSCWVAFSVLAERRR